ncbi:MAG: DUF2141 domain-containing protein [Verrucomicrobiales bacterium]
MKSPPDHSPRFRYGGKLALVLSAAAFVVGYSSSLKQVAHADDAQPARASAEAAGKVQSDGGTLRVVVTGLRNSKGHVLVSLYDRSKGFPRSREAIAKTCKIEALSGSEAEASFKNLPFGDYAIAVLHDEDKSGEMTYRMRVLPGEGFGFSNNPKVVAKSPSFKSAKISFSKGDQKTKIKLKY